MRGRPNSFAAVLEASAHDQLALCYLATTLELAGDERASDLLDYERMVFRVPIETPSNFKNRQDYFDALQSALEALDRSATGKLLNLSNKASEQEHRQVDFFSDYVIRNKIA